MTDLADAITQGVMRGAAAAALREVAKVSRSDPQGNVGVAVGSVLARAGLTVPELEETLRQVVLQIDLARARALRAAHPVEGTVRP